jgi:toxin FitB
MYLVDTNVISTGAPSRIASAALMDWMDTHSAALSLSAVTVTEIEDGITKLRREGATRNSTDVAAWWRALLHLYGERILPLDTRDRSDRRRLIRPSARPRSGARTGRPDHRGDGARHGLTILSRNLKHFAPLGVPVLDPFAALPL